MMPIVKVAQTTRWFKGPRKGEKEESFGFYCSCGEDDFSFEETKRGMTITCLGCYVDYEIDNFLNAEVVSTPP